jgi:hypothetical protein
MTAAKAGKKKAPTKAASAESERAALLAQAEQIPIRYDPVLLALSKADAARLLFVNAREMFAPGQGGESLEWIEGFAEDAFCEALEDAKVAYVKAVGAGTAVNPKQTPAAAAAEGAR